MSAIDDLPRETHFGKDFNYAQWSNKNSYASLHRVTWNSDYSNVAYFPTTNALNDFLDEQPKLSRFDFGYLKPNQPVKIDVPFNVAYEYNYLRVWNFEQPISGDNARWLYYFILDVEYVTPNTTRLHVQLDAWQTFIREIEFGTAYFEQGHIGVANSSLTDPTGARILTVPEGLDVGADYQVTHVSRHQLTSAVHDEEPANPSYKVMVVANNDLEAEPGTLESPVIKTAKGSMMENLPNGAGIYIFKQLGDFLTFVENISDTPWVSQGIVSITIVPTVDGMETWPTADIHGVNVYKPGWGTLKDRTRAGVDFRAEALANLPERYRHLKKFLTFPYLALELSTYTGTPLVLKPELWEGNARFIEKFHFAPPSPRMAIIPRGYNASGTSEEIDASTGNILHDGGEFFNVAAFITNFPQFSILNNGYLSVMAAQAHGIAQQYNAADWSQNRTTTGNQLAFDQASAGMGLNQDMAANTINAANQSTDLANFNAVVGGLQGGMNSIAGGISQGGAAGTISGAMGLVNAGISTAMSVNTNTMQNQISTGLTRSQSNAQVGNAVYMRDSNKNFADWAAKGDYQNQVASLNAKVQDAKLTQPSASGTVGGDSFMLAQYQWGYDLKIKMPNRGAIETIGEYWLRYGYAIRRFGKIPKDFKVMSHFSYWKLKECYIVSARCPEPFKQAIRGILEKGVTVWHQPELMGNVDMGLNTPINYNYFDNVGW